MSTDNRLVAAAQDAYVNGELTEADLEAALDDALKHDSPGPSTFAKRHGLDCSFGYGRETIRK